MSTRLPALLWSMVDFIFLPSICTTETVIARLQSDMKHSFAKVYTVLNSTISTSPHWRYVYTQLQFFHASIYRHIAYNSCPSSRIFSEQILLLLVAALGLKHRLKATDTGEEYQTVMTIYPFLHCSKFSNLLNSRFLTFLCVSIPLCPHLPIWVQHSHHHLPNHVAFEFSSSLAGLPPILPSVISCKAPSPPVISTSNPR